MHEEPYKFQPAPRAAQTTLPQFLLELVFILMAANLVHRWLY